jgi:hypothetical protein
MKCQRCMENERAAYRASSDVMAMNVCAACAAEAWGLGLTIEALRKGDKPVRAMGTTQPDP